MIYLINDTATSVVNQEISTSQGGTAAYLAGFIRFLQHNTISFRVIGNFNKAPVEKNEAILHPRSNAGFLLQLLVHLTTHSFTKDDVLYFQRPDHLFPGLFSKGKKVLHLHGQPRTIINQGRNILTRILYNFMEHIAMRTASRVITTDQDAAGLYEQVYPYLKGKIYIVPAGIDTSFFIPTDEKPSVEGISQAAKVLVYIGRLGYPKRVDQIINAFHLAHENDPLLRLIITGSGTNMNSLQQLVADFGLSGSIRFTGELPKKDIRKIIQASDAAILISSTEGSPVSLKECLACGIPVITNNVGDVKEYVIPGTTGRIVNPDDLNEIASAITSVIQSSKAMKEHCRQTALNYDEMKINHLIFEKLSF